MNLPQHIVSVPTDDTNDREAYAPYNFVPLPERMVAAQSLPSHDRYYPERHTGQLICTLTTASPLYVRCGYTPDEYANYGDKAFHELTPLQKQERAKFFHHSDSTAPVIPGSSLRGMLRALVEIAGYGKMERVLKQQLFYRSVADENYQKLFVETIKPAPHGVVPTFRTRIHSGFLRKSTGEYVIEECHYARIDHGANPRGLASIPLRPGQPLFEGNGPNRKPNWFYQNRRIYVLCDPTEQDYFFPAMPPRHPDLYLRFRGVKQASFDQNGIAGAEEGTLVITGHMQNKHLEFVFLNHLIDRHTISAEMVRRFEDDDQITQWQEGAFAHNKPTAGARQRDGLLRDGEPVFFLLNDDGSVRFFGRAQLFRLPYGIAPFDYVPPTHRSPEVVDLAEAIFGFVRQEKAKVRGIQTMLAGRVFVSDAQFVSAHDGVFLTKEALTPQVLGSPKPTTYQHYLVQPEQTNAVQRRLRRYDSDTGQTSLRGFKLYWHKGPIDEQAVREVNLQKIQSAPKQYTQIRPVKEGVTFVFTVHFENLSDVELGALLWVLRLAADKQYRLALGMGKPLGMGAVSITHEIRKHDRQASYRALFDGERWAMPTVEVNEEAYVKAFEDYVLQESNEASKYKSLRETLRMQCLLALLSWPGPNRRATRAMEIERDQQHPEGHRPGRINNGKVNEYSYRLVLPDPRQVLKEHPAPTPPPPPVKLEKLEIGVEVTGNRRGELRIASARGVRVDLNLKDFQLPKGKTVIGFVSRADAGGSTSGGFRGVINGFEVDGTTLYLILKPKSRR
jgi:CRISPR-associated protein (TIGR03986 family)